LSALVSTALAADAPDYLRDIKPLLKNRCSSCHGSLKQKAGLRLDAGSLIHAGADGEPVILADRTGRSPLIERVATADPDERMPPEGAPLSAKHIETLKAWIAAGAPYPKDEEIPVRPAEHWAFQTVQRPALPPVKNSAWPRNEIDHFVLARLETRGWKPNPDASAEQLLRRVHLDLIGLPPSLTEQASFEHDHAHSDYLSLIDDLLSRDGYGERYGRHWLDVARYADSNGYERDRAKPEVWRYRDYVIRSLNADKPFDQFVKEQLAGDELAVSGPESVTATGFNRLGPWDDEPADPLVDRYDQLDDIVNTTSQAFLALTMGCARCHDHKFDPLLQTDYYSMVAIFNPLQRPRAGRTELTRYAAPPQLAKLYEERDRKIAAERSAIRKIRDESNESFIRNGNSKLTSEIQLAFLVLPNKRDSSQKKLVKANQAKLDQESRSTLPESANAQIRKRDAIIDDLKKKLTDVHQAYILHEQGTAPETRLLERGNPRAPAQVVPPAVPIVLAESQPEFLKPGLTSRRRLSFANWLTLSDNPLTARVIVNRAWQWHFGHGIVRTPNDFGLIGEKPTHPKLLDWLAHWFVHDAEWSLKKLHRLIMTSRSYQMSRDGVAAYATEDPENRLLWRQPRHRLEVEAIRDSMLHVSGKLDRQMYGPAMYPFVPKDALLNHADKTSSWPVFDEKKASRRTIYAFVKRSLLVPMLEVLDLCDTTQSAAKRNVTTVPTQALTLFNGDFAIRQSRHFADRLLIKAGPELSDQIELAWQLALARAPSAAERRSMQRFHAEQVTELGSRKLALTEICRVIFNLNEFVYPD
jgi:hypothetical protein